MTKHLDSTPSPETGTYQFVPRISRLDETAITGRFLSEPRHTSSQRDSHPVRKDRPFFPASWTTPDDRRQGNLDRGNGRSLKQDGCYLCGEKMSVFIDVGEDMHGFCRGCYDSMDDIPNVFLTAIAFLREDA